MCKKNVWSAIFTIFTDRTLFHAHRANYYLRFSLTVCKKLFIAS